MDEWPGRLLARSITNNHKGEYIWTKHSWLVNGK